MPKVGRAKDACAFDLVRRQLTGECRHIGLAYSKAAGPLATSCGCLSRLGRILIADVRSIAHPKIMMNMSKFEAHCRIGLALIAAATIGSCGSAELKMPACWRANDLRQGLTFRGTVVLFAGAYDTGTSMFAVSCEQGVVADLPAGVSLPIPREDGSIVSAEHRFFQADVTGYVEGAAFGRPWVHLRQVEHVRRVMPLWLRTKAR